MDFNKLDNNLKEEIHFEISAFANTMGGKNFFLKMIEEIRSETPNPLLNKSGMFHTSKSKITLSKSMYKDTFQILFAAIRREDKGGDMLNGIAPKEYKATMNMMKALAKVVITVESKEETGGTYDFSILDTSEEKKTKVTFIFKALFFYHLDEAKKALAFKS